jgi:hypothetical protein
LLAEKELRQVLRAPADSTGTARDPAAHPLRVVPIGQAFRLASERAPADLHFMSLVSAAG